MIFGCGTLLGANIILQDNKTRQISTNHPSPFPFPSMGSCRILSTILTEWPYMIPCVDHDLVQDPDKDPTWRILPRILGDPGQDNTGDWTRFNPNLPYNLLCPCIINPLSSNINTLFFIQIKSNHWFIVTFTAGRLNCRIELIVNVGSLPLSLLVLWFYPVSSLPNSNSIWDTWTHLKEFLELLSAP